MPVVHLYLSRKKERDLNLATIQKDVLIMNLTTFIGRQAKADYYDPSNWEVFLRSGQTISQTELDRLIATGLAETEAQLQGILDTVPLHTKQWVGWGRHRSAIAQAILQPGNSQLTINGTTRNLYFKKSKPAAKAFLRKLLEFPQTKPIFEQYTVTVFVKGSTPQYGQQPHAVAHAIAHALVAYDPSLKPLLNQSGYARNKVPGHEKFVNL